MKTFRILPQVTNSDANIPGRLSTDSESAGFAAWVLVGGRSSRMGTDKALSNSNGRPLALRVADRAALVCSSVSLVGDPLIYVSLGLPVVADRFPHKGPLAGIEAALAATVCDKNLILACDMPAIEQSLLRELLTAAGDAAQPDCVVPIHADGRVEPLCAVYRQRCHSVVRAALDAGVRKVTDGLRGLAIRYVRTPDATHFANLNTPEDWQRYHHG